MKRSCYKIFTVVSVSVFLFFASGATIPSEPNKPITVIPPVKTVVPVENKQIETKQVESGSNADMVRIAKAELESKVYEKCLIIVMTAIGVIVTLVIVFVGYALFKNTKEYKEALTDVKEALSQAREAAREARDSRDKTRECEEKAQEVLRSIDKDVKGKLEEIDKVVNEKLAEIDKKGEKSIAALIKEADKQRKSSELWNEGLRAVNEKEYEKAADCFAKITQDPNLKDTPTAAGVYNNWGNALTELAKQKQGAEADRLFAESCDKYQKAVQIKPDLHEAYNNWGATSSEWARRKQGPDSERLFADACDKYQKAVQIKPDYHMVYNNWGTALLELAKQKQGAEADKLFAESCDKYQKAVQIKPDKHETYNNWGTALSDWAKQKQGAEADKLFAESCDKYQKAVQIKPDYYEAYYNWGTALLELAKQKKDDVRRKLLEDAEEKLLKAESIKTGKSAYNLACLFALLGDETNCRKWLETGEKYGTLPPRSKAMADTDLASVREKDWFKAIRWPEG